MMKLYIVSTDAGEYTTRAVSPRKAIANVRWRLYGRFGDASDTIYWTVREANSPA